MTRREAAERIEQIRSLMARAGEFRHLSGWASIVNGLLVFAGCWVCNKVRFVSFNAPGNDPYALAAVWGPVAALGVSVDVLFTVALARRRGETPWSPSARQLTAGLLPGLYAGAVLTVYLGGTGLFEALPGAWMVCYGTALMGASLFAPWEVRYVGLAFLLFGGAALVFLQDRAMLSMGLGFGVIHLLFGVYVLWKYRGEGGRVDGRRGRGAEEQRSGGEEERRSREAGAKDDAGNERWDTGTRWGGDGS